MRKIKLTLLAIALLSSSVVLAQENYDYYENDNRVRRPSRLRNKYTNLSFVNQTLTTPIGTTHKSEYGAALTVGRTFLVHRRPIAGMIRIGADATWIDLNYTNYKYTEQDASSSDTYDVKIHQAEVGMQVGPSISVSPINKLNIQAYFRYAPSFSAMYDGDDVYGGYGNYFVTGGTVSYGIIGVGIEYRFGSSKLKALAGDGGNLDSGKSKFSGFRVFVSFKF